MTDRSLGDVIQLETSGSATIPASFLEKVDGNSRIAIYVKSRHDIVIKVFNKENDEKIFNVYLEIEKNEMRPVVKWIGNNISSEKIVWTSGFCVPESGEKIFTDYNACMWQGVVKFPASKNIDDVKKFFKEINLREDKIIVTKATIHEV